MDVPTPTAAVYSLTKELEHSLDLQSATSGSRLVTAVEVTYILTIVHVKVFVLSLGFMQVNSSNIWKPTTEQNVTFVLKDESAMAERESNDCNSKNRGSSSSTDTPVSSKESQLKDAEGAAARLSPDAECTAPIEEEYEEILSEDGGILVRGQDGEEIELPKGMPRPRTNSGSRFLTDKVCTTCMSLFQL